MSLAPSSTPKAERPGHWVEIGVLVAILTAAAFLRFVWLDAVPPGMTHDEAAFGAEAELILAGQRPIYFALGYGHEPIYAYLVALTFALLGHTLIALRVTSAVCGLLVVVGTYLLSRRMYGYRVAWISAAWMAVAFWPLSLSRQALRAITLPMLWLPAARWFWRGFQVSSFKFQVPGSRLQIGPETWNLEPGTWNFVLSGLFLGLSFYTYMASRVVWMVFPLFGLYLLFRKGTRAVFKWTWPGIMILLVVAGLVVLPMIMYLRAHPTSEVRVGLMMGSVRELLAGKPERVLRHTWNALRAFSWVGDRFWAYNIPGRPIFNWVGSTLFYLGLIVALWRWREPRYAFSLIWLLVGLAPAMVTTNEGVFLRAIVAQPVTYVLVAVGLRVVGDGLQIAICKVQITDRLKMAAKRWTQAAWVGLGVGLILMEGVRTCRAYFLDWPNRPEARNIYNHNLVAVARYMRDELEGPLPGDALGVSALYPLYYHDPWILSYVGGRKDPRIRWFDGRGGIVYPGEGEAWYVFSALTPLHVALWPDFESRASLVERRELKASDQNPTFEVWRWRGHDALSDRLDMLRATSPMWISPEVQFTQPELRRALEGPAQFGDAQSGAVMALVGYEFEGPTVKPGDAVELVTYWRAMRTVQGQDDWNTFVHLLDRNSRVIGGVDVLHCPPTGWHPGDVIVQVHPFQVAGDAPRGEAYLEIGVYRRTAGRVSVIIGGQYGVDRVLLAPVRVE